MTKIKAQLKNLQCQLQNNIQSQDVTKDDIRAKLFPKQRKNSAITEENTDQESNTNIAMKNS